MKICLALLCLGVLLTQVEASGRRRWRPWKCTVGNRRLRPWAPRCIDGLDAAVRDIQRDVDLVHVIESSSYIGWFWFQMGLQFAGDNTVALDNWRPIAADKSRVALIRFSSNHSTAVEFHLGDYNNLGAIIHHMMTGVPYISDPGVAIGDALRMAKFEFKNHSNEDVDPTNSKIVWLYSSGNQKDWGDTITEATILKEIYKVKLCVIPIGTVTDVGNDLLKEIASPDCFFPLDKSSESCRLALIQAARRSRCLSQGRRTRFLVRK